MRDTLSETVGSFWVKMEGISKEPNKKLYAILS
jgi:hypothetical protein